MHIYKSCNYGMVKWNELHFFLRKVQLVWKIGLSCTFLEKTSIPMENRFELHTSWEKFNSARKQVWVAHLFRKVQLVRKIGLSCPFFLRKAQLVRKIGLTCKFLLKSATSMENSFELHISWEKCNAYGNWFELHTLWEKCNSMF
jgi:hypothetical protein